MATIISFELQNIKRVKVVEVECDGKPLFIMGGNNGQGKTSVLNALQWALLGKTYAPSGLKREGALGDPAIKVTLSNGLVVERYGENGNLKITDPAGNVSKRESDLKHNINLLSLDLSKFLNGSDKEKAGYLLSIIGNQQQLEALDKKEAELESNRLLTGRDKRSKEAFADNLPQYPDAPAEPVLITALLERQHQITAKNNENRKWRECHTTNQIKLNQMDAEISIKEAELKALIDKAEILRKEVAEAETCVADLKDEDVAAIEAEIRDSESVNEKVRANQEKLKAKKAALAVAEEYDKQTREIEDIRRDRTALLNAVTLPLPGLSIANTELIYNGKKWDCMSGAEQLIVATSIVRKMNPDCGFVLIDKIEQMDIKTLSEFGKWLDTEGMQAITTRVSQGDECSIIIEDGMVTTKETSI